MAPKRKSVAKADPKRIKKTRTQKTAPSRPPSGDGPSAVRSPGNVTPRRLATVAATPIRRSPRVASRCESAVIGEGSSMKRKTLDGNVGVHGGSSEEERELEEDIVVGDSDDNDDMLEENSAGPRSTNRGGSASRLQPLTARLSQSRDERPPGLLRRKYHPSRSSQPSSYLPIASERPRSAFNLRVHERSSVDSDGERNKDIREERVPSTPAPCNLSMVAELREHQRGLVTATKKLTARSEAKILERFEVIGKEVNAIFSMVKYQKNELELLKEYMNMLMYAVGGKGRDGTSLMTVVRAGVEKLFSSSNILPVLRKALVSWSVLGLWTMKTE